MTTMRVRVIIPEGLDFEALKLTRGPKGTTFDCWAPIQGIDVDLLRSSEDNVTSLTVDWYVVHLKLGGAPDPVMEQLFAEVDAGDERDAASVQASTGRLQ